MRPYARPISFAANHAGIELIRPSERHCETQVAVRGEVIGRCRVARVVPVEAEVEIVPHLTFDGN